MKMKKKLYMAFLSFLACVSLVSVGYASWTIASGNAEASGVITAEDVYYSDDYANIRKNPLTPFAYCHYGFVNDEQKLTDTNILSVKVTLMDLYAYKNKFGVGKDSLMVELEIGQISNYPLFDDTNNIISVTNSVNKNIDESITPTDKTEFINSNKIILKFNLPKVLNADTYTFYVDLTFKNNASDSLNVGDNTFKNNLFDVFHTPNLFYANVKLSAYKSGGVA